MSRVPSAGSLFSSVNPTRSVRTLVVVVGVIVALLAMFRGTLHHHDIYTESRRPHHGSYKVDKHESGKPLLPQTNSKVAVSTKGLPNEVTTPLQERAATEIAPSRGLDGSKPVEGEANSREGADSSSEHKKVPGKEQKEHRNTNAHEKASRGGVNAHAKAKTGRDHMKEVAKKKEPVITGSNRSERPAAAVDPKSSTDSSSARAMTETPSKVESTIESKDNREKSTQPLSMQTEEGLSESISKRLEKLDAAEHLGGETPLEKLERELKEKQAEALESVEELNKVREELKKQQEEIKVASDTVTLSSIAPLEVTPPSTGQSEDAEEEDEALKIQQEAEERERAADAAEKAASDGSEAESTDEQEDEQALSIDDPAVKNLLAKRKPHPGPFMHIRWPPGQDKKQSRRAVHLRLHLRQFFEDGSFGMNQNPKHAAKNIIGQRPYLDYIAKGGDNNLVLSRYNFHPAVLPFLPKEDASWKFNTCAIVSNSGSLLENEYGAEIDSRDAVFRINYPPIEGFEKHVGSKSTFEITNMHHVQLIADPNWRHPLLKRGTRTFRAPPDNPNAGTATLVLFESTVSAGWRFHLVPRLLHRYPSPKTVILSPDLVVAGEEAWRHIYQDVADKTDTCRAMARRAEKQLGAQHPHLSVQQLEVCKPTSGWHTLVFAFQICEEVHMYGFSGWRKHSKVRQAKYHYFDNVTGVTNVHSFDLSLRIYQELARHYRLFVHT